MIMDICELLCSYVDLSLKSTRFVLNTFLTKRKKKIHTKNTLTRSTVVFRNEIGKNPYFYTLRF